MKERPRAIAVLIAVFLVECLAGSAGSFFYFKKTPDSGRRPPDFGDGAMRNGPMPRPEPMNFREILQLTPEQDAEFKQILGESRKQMTEFREQTDDFHSEQDAKIKAIISEMNRKLNSILNEVAEEEICGMAEGFRKQQKAASAQKGLSAAAGIEHCPRNFRIRVPVIPKQRSRALYARPSEPPRYRPS